MIPTFIIKNRDLERKYADAFRRTFGIRLHDYMDYVTGFDLIRFDAEFLRSEDRSMAEALRERHGDEAVDLIKALIGDAP